MDLETAHSRPVQPDRRNAILRGVLLRRRDELRKSWKHLVSAADLESLGSLAPEVESFLSGRDSIRNSPLPAAFTWLNCDADFWGCLCTIALARKIECRPADTSQARLSFDDFKKLSGADLFKVLCARYRCPLNIGAASELEVAEELLRQLMVTDRAKLERGAAFDVDVVLLKLNLVGIRALVTHDLRSLDALNYFYELPQRSLTRMRANSRLLVSWLCIYMQLLATPDWLKCG
jgi:hypothetical protein